jgi:hypothetical protein
MVRWKPAFGRSKLYGSMDTPPSFGGLDPAMHDEKVIFFTIMIRFNIDKLFDLFSHNKPAVLPVLVLMDTNIFCATISAQILTEAAVVGAKVCMLPSAGSQRGSRRWLRRPVHRLEPLPRSLAAPPSASS